jgi:AraC-like DNA-binding protein
MNSFIVDGSITAFDYTVNHIISTSLHMPNFHFHDLYEIYFSLTSNINCFINDRVYPVERGDVFLFSPTDFHKFVVPENLRYERYFLLFNREYITPLCTEKTNLLQCFESRENSFYHKIHLKEEELENFSSLLKEAQNYSDFNTYGYDIKKKFTLAQILMVINSLSHNKEITSTMKQEDKHTKIWPILKYIDDNLNQTLTLDHLASNFYISKYYMEVIFKSSIGFSINEYIVNKRILKSKELLKKNTTVSQVAEMVGFNSDSHFIRTFKKLVGISPKQYAKTVK